MRCMCKGTRQGEAAQKMPDAKQPAAAKQPAKAAAEAKPAAKAPAKRARAQAATLAAAADSDEGDAVRARRLCCMPLPCVCRAFSSGRWVWLLEREEWCWAGC